MNADAIRGWLDVAEDAFCDGERKTCEDMLREAYRAFRAVEPVLSVRDRRECWGTIQALVRNLNAHVVRPVYPH